MVKNESLVRSARCFSDTMTKISLVIAVHNEQKYLPYLLSSLIRCQVHEAIFVLDRCTDNSKRLLERTCLPFQKRIIELKNKKWHSVTAEPFAIGFEAAEGNWIFAVGADLYLDPATFQKDLSGLDFVSFSLRGYSLFRDSFSKVKLNTQDYIQSLYEKLRSFSLRKHYGTGLYGVTREAYTIVPHRDRSDEDSHLLMSLERKGFRYMFFKGHSLHLRPNNERNAKKYAVRMANHHLFRIIWFVLRYPSKTFIHECLWIKKRARSFVIP